MPLFQGEIVTKYRPDYAIVDNDIEANTNGIMANHSKGKIDLNRIGLNSTGMPFGLRNFMSSVQISDNTIVSDEENIRCNSIFESSVNNNDLTNANVGVMGIGGMTDTNIDYNIIDSEVGGILIENSGGNTFTCNDIVSEIDGILVDVNSDQQLVLGNTLDGDQNDVVIKSVIGVQEHYGNYFVGEQITAEGLLFAEVFFSRFVVDQNSQDLIPAFPNPQNLSDPQQAGNSTFDCDVNPGPRMTQRFLDTIVICQYLDKLDSLKFSSPNYYWNAKYHLMRYYSLKVPITEWPNCINLYWNSEFTCGIKELVAGEIEFKNALSGNGFTFNNINEFELGLNSIVSQQTNSLSSVICTDEISAIWIDVYLLVLKGLSDNSLSLQEQSDLDIIAKKCFSDYGDAVHWARNLLSEYNSVNYKVFDTCIQTPENRSRQLNTMELNEMKVMPNPTSGFLNFENVVYKDGELRIYDISGKLILSHIINETNFTLDISHLENGVYIIKAYNQGENKFIARIIKQD